MAEKKEKKELENVPFRRRLTLLQNELYAPKNQFNKFGGYRYRNCEDIYNAVKPLLKKYGMTLTMTDDIENYGDRFYVRTRAVLTDALTGMSVAFNPSSGVQLTDTSSIIVTAYAREEETKKGQDGSQITGASSSYARKYALNGLFLIDDVKDSDTTNTETKVPFKNEDIMKENKYRSWLDDFFYRHPDRKVKFLNYYRINTLDELDGVLTLKEIDNIISKLRKEEESNDK